jgi:ABC-type polar amino acid transport system ATPase subunit
MRARVILSPATWFKGSSLQLDFMDAGKIVEENNPEGFFNTPKEERTKLFLSQILHH